MKKISIIYLKLKQGTAYKPADSLHLRECCEIQGRKLHMSDGKRAIRPPPKEESGILLFHLDSPKTTHFVI